MQCNVPMEGGVARTTLEKLFLACCCWGWAEGGTQDTGVKCKQEGIPIWFSTNQRANCLEGPSPFLLRRLTRTVWLTVCL